MHASHDGCSCLPKDLAAQVQDARYKYYGQITNKAQFQGQQVYFVRVEDCIDESPCPDRILVKSKAQCPWDSLDVNKSYTFLLDEDYEMDSCSCDVNADFSKVKKICKGGKKVCPSKLFAKNEMCDLCQKLKDAACEDDGSDDIVCPAIYDPVCALAKDGEKKTFSNSCVANRENAKIIYQGECTNSDCCCSGKKDYVCAETSDGQQVTFDNACIARCKGARLVNEGQCSDTDMCICPAVIDYKCAMTPSGEKKTYQNACGAACDNAVVLYDGQCTSEPAPGTCGCDMTDFSKVCAVTNRGRLQTYQNVCLARCDNSRAIYNGECM